ncbi:MAG TPA: ATP-binding protein, partial [Methylomirabilota bacterium]|nr:ATP-binding protein [Methylomirabilota bacterium]
TYLESETRTLATQCGVSHMITKPAEPEKILQVVNEVLGMPQTPVTPPPIEEFRRNHLGLLLTKLAQKAETVAPRLDAMIELGLQFASERDPHRLLGSFCGAARKIVGARHATVALLDRENGMLHHRFTSGMNPETSARLDSPLPRVALPGNALSEQHPCRLHALPGDPRVVGLPGEHPPVHSFLSAPISSPDRIYGWLCLTNKLGTSGFNEEDEGLAQILCAQVGRIYENGSLYSEIQRTVQRLEAEVAERKQAQEEVRKLNAELERRVARRTGELAAANKELEAFSYSVSHDLRTPLRHIAGYTGILSAELGSLATPETRRLLDIISKSAGHMGQLIEDLLNLSRINRRELRYSTVPLSEIARGILNELKQASPHREVECVIAPDLRVRGDLNLLRIALDNLLRNAWKFTQKHPLSRIEVGAAEQEGETVCFVRDNGAGFDMAYVNKLFGAFQRLHSEAEFEGTGIGLAIVQRVILRHGGRIWAEGGVDEGATFYFLLPKTPDTDA